MLALPGGSSQTKWRGKALYGDGVLAWASGDPEAAHRELAESVAIFRQLGDSLGLAHALHFLGSVVSGMGDHQSACPLCEESVAIFRGQHDAFGLAVALASLGIVRTGMGDYDLARTLLEESVAQCRKINDRWALSLPMRNLGVVALRLGNYEYAAALLRESLAILRETKEKWFISRSLETLAGVTALLGDCSGAAQLFGAGEALREEVGASVLLLLSRGLRSRRCGRARRTWRASVRTRVGGRASAHMGAGHRLRALVIIRCRRSALVWLALVLTDRLGAAYRGMLKTMSGTTPRSCTNPAAWRFVQVIPVQRHRHRQP